VVLHFIQSRTPRVIHNGGTHNGIGLGAGPELPSRAAQEVLVEVVALSLDSHTYAFISSLGIRQLLEALPAADSRRATSSAIRCVLRTAHAGTQATGYRSTRVSRLTRARSSATACATSMRSNG